MKYWFYIIKKYIFRSKPLALIFFVTSRCNCRCRHCFYYIQQNDTSLDELSIEEIEKFAKALGSLLYIDITGGEPFLRKDLYHIVKIFHEKSAPRKITITTNGFFTQETVDFCEKASRLEKVHIELNISIDAMGRDHNSIRGVDGIFEKAISTFRTLKGLYLGSSVRLGFIMTFMKDNMDTLEDTINYLCGMDPDFISLNLIRGDVRNPVQKEIGYGKFEKYLGVIGSVGERSGKSILDRLRNAKTELIVEYRKKIFMDNAFTNACLAGTSICVLYPDGQIRPCELLEESFGNIKYHNYDIGKMWKNPLGKKFRREISDDKCRCTHECFLTASTTFSPLHFIKILFLALRKKTGI